ncbi:profilin-like [Haliotis rubra]|uniref:profilin-like n=1 Tax=Haliotis rubra TaxID=36100 RepID=UPI001EE556EB|nr:profilin-like [Haliotis rubra]XP_046545940.1 profilin-like [Haliotis rubra]
MSWDEQVKTMGSYTGDKMFYGAINGLDGNKWASKGAMEVSQEEVLFAIKVCSHNGSELGKAQGSGIYLAGKKFKFLRSDSEEKSVTFTRSENEKLHNGFAILTKQTILICVCEEEGKGSAASTGACKMADYLQSVDY